MRQPKYLSHSAYQLWHRDRTEYYLKYLADTKTPNIPQTPAMAIGSGFDAFVKAYLTRELYGEEKAFDAKELFDQQVEEHNREETWPRAQFVFESYVMSGALASLMRELTVAGINPQFEFRIQRDIRMEKNDVGVPLLGLPDVFFQLRDGTNVILDFKVTGFFSNSPRSPKKNYINVSDGWINIAIQPSRNVGPHKNAVIEDYNGLLINTACNIEDIDETWANQLALYGWLKGAPVGGTIIAGIEELVCSPCSETEYPKVRVANFRGMIGRKYQIAFYERLLGQWNTLKSVRFNEDGRVVEYPHIFSELTKDASDQKCEDLEGFQDKLKEIGEKEGGANAQWLQDTIREHSMWAL